MGRVERGRTGGAGEDGGDGGGCFQDQSRAPTGAGVSLPIQPDEHRFVSLSLSRCRSAAALRTGPYMVLRRGEVITETVLETLSQRSQRSVT